VPDPAILSSALDETITQGREFMKRMQSLADAFASELASANESISALQAKVDRADGEREELMKAREEDARNFKAKLAEAQAAIADQANRVGRIQTELATVTQDRDALQADQLQWGVEREQLLGELNQAKARAVEMKNQMGAERDELAAIRSRHAELTEQSSKLAAEWATRRQALAAEIAAQNAEMEQVRRALQESQERENRLATGSGTLGGSGSVGVEHSHEINSRLNALVGFSSLLLDERNHAYTPEERREFLKYVNESAVRLADAIRPMTGNRTVRSESGEPIVDRERRAPDILVADADVAAHARIEPFLKRAGYEVVYVDNGNKVLEKAATVQPIAILIDSQLPPNGAVGLVKELRKDPRARDIPVVIMAASGSAPPPAIADCDFLAKPVDRQQLVQLMVRYDLVADNKRARKLPANVLVIDDDPQAVGLVKAILKPFNVRLTAVDNAKGGIEQALRNKPDLVILDLLLPDAEGFEVVEAIRRDKDLSRVPILVQTAKPLTAEDRRRLEGKVESIMGKADFQPERFLELLIKRGERRKRAA
jgi:CheY-like chemotaxis protein